jgi:hypothetical protein
MFNKVHLTSPTIGPTAVILNTGRFEDLGMISGMKLSAWDKVRNIPVGEAILTDETEYYFGSEFSTITPVFYTSLGSLSVSASSRQSAVGTSIGKIIFVKTQSSNTFYVSAVEVGTGKSQIVSISATVVGPLGYIDYDFSDLGFKLRLTLPSGSDLTAEQLANIVGNPNHDLFIREAVKAEVTIGFPEQILINDDTDPDVNHYNYGWRAWTDPTQNELTEDLFAPNNLWRPIFGEFTKIETLTSSQVKQIKDYQEHKLALNNGTLIEKYLSEWSEYTQLYDSKIDFLYDGSATQRFVKFDAESSLDKNRIFVYIDGILQSTASYSITNNVIEFGAPIMNVIHIGSRVVVVYKKYQPTGEELSFNPESEDDISKNTQYKFAYDYVSKQIRDVDGKIVGSKYYFWVKGKNTSAFGKKMSISQARNLLDIGPSMYMTFQNILEATDTLPVRYDAVTIFGINKFVTK